MIPACEKQLIDACLSVFSGRQASLLRNLADI
jgi:hypothetical protein